MEMYQYNKAHYNDVRANARKGGTNYGSTGKIRESSVNFLSELMSFNDDPFKPALLDANMTGQ